MTSNLTPPRIAHILEPHSAPTSQGGYDYSTNIMTTLLGHVGLTLKDGLVVHWTTPAEVTATLAAYQPTLVVLWEHHGHMLRAFSGGQHRSLDDWKGYVWRADAIAPGVKCLATYAPSRITKEWGLTGVCKFHLARVAREAATSELVVPPLHIEVLAPWHGFTAQDVVARLHFLRLQQLPLSHDIEGGCNMGPACYGFADSATHAIVVPIYDVDGCSIWSESDEVLITMAIQELLEDPKVPKIIQNGNYEIFVEAWTLGIVVHGLVDDTMLKTFELYAELEKSLEFQASIYTSQPYWKLDHKEVEGRYVPFKNGRRATTEEWFIYNGTDCCVTYEVNQVMEGMLKPLQREHYQFNVRLLVPMAYMSLRGLRYDEETAKVRLEETRRKIYELQDEINREAAGGRPALQEFYEAFNKVSEVPKLHGAVLETKILPLLTSAFCQARRTIKQEVTETSWQPRKWNGKKWVKAGKRLTDPDQAKDYLFTAGIEDGPWEDKPPTEGQVHVALEVVQKQVTRNTPFEIKTLEDVRRFTKTSETEACNRARRLVAEMFSANGTCGSRPAERGELATLLNLSININSTPQGGDAQWYVFNHCGAPAQFIKEAGRNTTRLTTGNSAVLEAYIATQDPRLATFMAWRGVDTRREALQATPDPDGRMRCSYTLPGTDTYRCSCSKSQTGTGYQLQTVTEDLRDLFPADEGCEFGQFDLRGADGWTLAAECAKVGDMTMLLDLQAGIKPVNVVVLLYTEGPHINQLSREELLVAQKRVAKDSWQYKATKPILYGRSYLMGPKKMSAGIAEDSYAETGVPIVVSPKKCEEIILMIDLRYPGIPRWQDVAGRTMMEQGVLHTTVGWSRRFFGRKRSVNNRAKPDRTTHGAWLGTLPQFNTTYATKMGLSKLWADPANRRVDGSLRIEPLHTVHDSLNTQWKVEDREFARSKVLPEYFNNPFNVAGQVLVIPAAGTYGRSWGEQGGSL